MRKIKEKMNSLNTARTLIVACALLCAGAARAQSYIITHQNDTVKHKPAKWYDLRTSLGISTDDDFDADEESKYTTLADGSTKIQSAHETVDTIYMHRGTTTELRISDYHPNAKNSTTYQRWYDYETDGNVMNGTTYLLKATTLTYSGGEQNATNMYVFSNGIVGKPLTSRNLHSMYFTFPNDESINEYIVACDVSGYRDFSAEYKDDTSDSPSFGDSNTYYEPTISHRFIYYIIAIEDENSWANKRLTAGEPIDEEDITMPATRIPNNTNEMVALPMDARSYITPNGNTNEANENLTISLGDNTAGITLVTTTISDRDRVIHFTYPKTNTDGTQSVDTPESGEDATATIEVKRGNTVVARFNLTFKEESRLLSQSQLKVINEGTYTENGLLSGYTFRNLDLLSEEYELLTELNFDYDADIAAKYGQAEYYPFPLGWNDISYGFYDGSVDYANGFKKPSAPCPEWGYYGIQSCYVECSTSYGWASQTAPVDTESIRFNSSGKQSTYHLYTDASDRPDIIAKLPFKENLCSGTKLYVTAWVKCALSTNANNAAALFTLLGVSTDDDGNTKYTPVYRFQTGQIPNSLKTQVASSNWTLKDTYEGFETTRNDWMQVYFTFTNDADVDYDSYVLQINNNSASTIGGDMYIDDIRIYIATPEATITQLNPTCTGDETLMNMTFDWERLTSRLGVNTETTDTSAQSGIDYCFVDKEVYENYLAENSDDYAGAIEAAVVTISDSESDENGSEYKTLYFYYIFNQNTAYEEDTHPQLASEIDDFLYRTTDSNGIQQLTADFYATLTPNRTYLMLMKPHTEETVDAQHFAADITSPCAIKTSFYVTSQTLLRLNGTVADPTTDYCEGQIVNFTVELRVPTTEVDDSGLQTYTTVSDGVYFDWFFGTQEEYINTSYPDKSYNGTSLKDALTTFRNILQFEDYDDLTGVTAGKYTGIDGSTEVTLTQADIDIIQYYLDAEKLILHKSSLNITITSGGLTLVVQPIPMQISPDESISDDEWQNICWSYIPLELSVTGQSPTLRAGFSDISYPSDTFDPCLRIGLDQINSTSESNTLTVNMRGISYTSDDIDHLGMISDEAYQKIFLISTDDPAYASFFSEEVGEFDEYSLPIGTIVSLNAKAGETTNVTKFYFDTTTETNGFTFTPREGYTYTFALHFQEYTDENESETSSACYGMFNIPMKVVPKYLVWQGTDGVTNWNKDDNWKRADRTELKKTDDSYDTNETNKTDNGFVPMLFSNVVMPENSKVQLYMAGFTSDTQKEWKEDEIPDGMEAATDDIQYDLMVYEDSDNKFSTQLYRVNLCDSIHFEKGAQMLHAEQLLYGNASMDIPIVNNTWVTVSTPLKDIMSGDWYTQTTGSQETEYFQDITFTDDYSRVNPAVFQRSWGDAATILTTASATTGNVVSFAANWSATYNDASVPYYAGAGYSIRGWKSGTNSLLFRMPKADDSYDYSTTTFTRDNNGKLKISDLVDRSTQANDYNDYTAKDTVMVTLTAANGDESYLMVGNPYMTALDVQAFLSNNYNKSTLAQEYWYVADEGTLTAVTYDSESSTWTANTTYIAPYSVFYVKAAQEGAEEVEVFFTEDMQAFDTSDDEEEVTNALSITATSESGKSVATVNYASTANNGYDRLEDAELLSGIGENDGPQVFTAADNTAISGNQVKDLTRIPLGVYADDDETVTVTFDNVAAIEDASLYDAETLTTTTLYDGYELQVTGNSYGRYFLMGTGPGTTSINEITTETGVQVSSLLHRQVVVTSNTAIKEVTVWSASGALLGKVSLNGDYTCTLNGIASGVAIVKVTTGDSSITKKLMIK